MMPALPSGPEATALLERSINYARGMVRGITTEELSRPTPCRDWNLHMLMLHLNESLTTLHQGITTHHLPPPTPSPSGDDKALQANTGAPPPAPSRDEKVLPDDGEGSTFPSAPSSSGAEGVDPAIGLVAVFRYQAGGLLGSCVNGVGGSTDIGDRAMPTAIVAATGALEIAVHGWDVGTARDQRSAIPDQLAATLLDLATVLVPADNRGPLFASPIAPLSHSGPGDRLIAFLGRAVS